MKMKIEINNSKEVFEKAEFPTKDQECFLVMVLNSRKVLIEQKLIFLGTADSSIVHPREIFRYAIHKNASAIVLIHNHPSGNPAPSPEDIKVTKTLVDSGKLLAIPVLDHIIVGDNRYYSFADEGEINLE